MIQELAPRVPRGWSKVWLALVIATPLTLSASAQEAPPAAKGEDPKPPADAAVAAPVVAGNRPAQPIQEIFPDPLSKQALQVFSPLPYPSPPFKVVGTPNEGDAVRNMASGQIAINQDQIRRYVDYYAAELSKRDNLNAFINSGAQVNPNAAKAIEKAVDALINPITVARANNNPNNFLGVYARQMFDGNFVKLLDNNLFARIDAMIVLGMLGSPIPKDLDVYIAQISKPDQVIWVKQWAARGLSTATNDGKSTVDAAVTLRALEAVSKFLAGDARTMPWPVQLRVLEAMASLRTAVSVTARNRTDAASAVMPYLIDPTLRPEVRAAAARALGWMTVPGGLRGYNFALLGDALGQLAADLGDKIVAEYDSNLDNWANRNIRATELTALLLFQVFGAIGGDPSAKETGLTQMTHPDARAQSAYFKDLSERVQAMSKSAVELIRGGGVDIQKGNRDKLADQVKGLRAFLASKAPKDRNLVPNGPEFPSAKAP